MRFVGVLVWFAWATTLAACGSVQHELRLNDGYLPQPGTNVEVEAVSNATGQTFDIDVEQMFWAALSEKLGHAQLSRPGTSGPKLALRTKIVEYEKGDAFKRWLLPGWGATVLSVHSDVMDGGRLVGTIAARRTVSAGGGYTIGAWKTIFNSVADDIVSDLKSKLPESLE